MIIKIKNGIHIGLNTQTQDQLIWPVSFKAINNRPKKPKKPVPDLLFSFSIIHSPLFSALLVKIHSDHLSLSISFQWFQDRLTPFNFVHKNSTPQMSEC